MFKIFHVSIDDVDYNLKVIKRKNCKKLILRINFKTRNPQISIPPTLHYKDGLIFFHRNYDWVKKQLDIQDTPKHRFSELQNLPFYGENYKVSKVLGKKNTVTIYKENKEIIITHKENTNVEKLFINFLKKTAYEYFYDLSKNKALLINNSFRLLKVSDTYSKWGSCSKSKILRYNFRLIMAPKFVIEYIVAHEVAHLQEFHHQKSFWNLVNKLNNNTTTAQEWLKINGNSLY